MKVSLGEQMDAQVGRRYQTDYLSAMQLIRVAFTTELSDGAGSSQIFRGSA